MQEDSCWEWGGCRKVGVVMGDGPTHLQLVSLLLERHLVSPLVAVYFRRQQNALLAADGPSYHPTTRRALTTTITTVPTDSSASPRQHTAAVKRGKSNYMTSTHLLRRCTAVDGGAHLAGSNTRVSRSRTSSSSATARATRRTSAMHTGHDRPTSAHAVGTAPRLGSVKPRSKLGAHMADLLANSPHLCMAAVTQQVRAA